MKIIVKAFLAEKGVQANSKAWHKRHAERTRQTHGHRSFSVKTELKGEGQEDLSGPCKRHVDVERHEENLQV